MKGLLKSDLGRTAGRVAWGLVLVVACLTTAIVAINRTALAETKTQPMYWTGRQTYELQTNHKAGLKIGATGYSIASTGNATLKAITGTTGTFSGAVLGALNVIDYTTTATARTITAAETGTVFTMSSTSDDPTTFTLPAAAAGLRYTFIDDDATAAADLCIDTQTGDKINNQTAGVSYNATGDAFGETVTLVAIDDTNWVPIAKLGTWSTGTP